MLRGRRLSRGRRSGNRRWKALGGGRRAWWWQMSGHDALTLILSVVFSVIFVILSVMVVHAIRSLSKATPVMANQAPVPLRTVSACACPPPWPPRRRKDRGEIELLPPGSTVTFADERR